MSSDIVKITVTVATDHDADKVYQAYQTLMDALKQTDAAIGQAEYWLYEQAENTLR